MTNPRAKYCSDKCRMSFKRQVDPNKPEQIDPNKSPEQPEQSNPNKQPEQIKKLSAEELYNKIGHYPNDTWKDSQEYRELKRRLNTMTIKDLRDSGHWMPNWRLSKG